MGERKHYLHTKLPVLSGFLTASKKKLCINTVAKGLKPCYDPFFYVKQGQIDKMAPVLPIRSRIPSYRSLNEEPEVGSVLKRYGSLEKISGHSPVHNLLGSPSSRKLRCFTLKKVKKQGSKTAFLKLLKNNEGMAKARSGNISPKHTHSFVAGNSGEVTFRVIPCV